MRQNLDFFFLEFLHSTTWKEEYETWVVRDDKAQFYSGIPARWLVLAAGHIKIRMPIVEKFCYQDQNDWLGQSFGVAKAGRICQPLNSNTIYGNVWWRTVMTKVTEGYMMVSISRLEFWQRSSEKASTCLAGYLVRPKSFLLSQPAAMSQCPSL